MSLLASLLTVKARLAKLATEAEKPEDAQDYTKDYASRILKGEGTDYPSRKGRALSQLSGRLSLSVDQLPFVSAVLETFAQEVVLLCSGEAETLEKQLTDASEDAKLSKDRLYAAQRSFLQELVAVKQRLRPNPMASDSEFAASKFFDPLTSLDEPTRGLVESLVQERSEEIAAYYEMHSVPVDVHLTTRKSLEHEIAGLKDQQAKREGSLGNFSNFRSDQVHVDEGLVYIADRLRRQVDEAEVEIATLKASTEQLTASKNFMEREISDLCLRLAQPRPGNCDRQVNTDSCARAVQSVSGPMGRVAIVGKCADETPCDQRSLSVRMTRLNVEGFAASPPPPRKQVPDATGVRRQRMADCPPLPAGKEEIFEHPSFFSSPFVSMVEPKRYRPDWKLPGVRDAQIAKKLDVTQIPAKPAELRRWKEGDVIGILNKQQVDITETYPVDSLS